jgi:Acyclic terpene utilisation family protein AtuA
VVSGDDVRDLVRSMPSRGLLETGAPLSSILMRMASANAYLGADVVAKALATGARIVITGRVSDPSLFLGPAMHEFGWSYNDLAAVGRRSCRRSPPRVLSPSQRRLLRRSGKKDVKDRATLGYPFADVDADGGVTIGKLDINGGRVDVATCPEQLLYEIHDPSSYITPHCVLDITGRAAWTGRQGSRRGKGSKGPAAHADIQGHDWLPRWLHRRRTGVVWRPQRGRSRQARRRDR